VSALGGEERTLTEVRPYPRGRTLLIGHLVAWTPDGRNLVVADRGADATGGLVLINTDSGGRTPLTSPAQGRFDVEPSLASDGRLLLFNRIRGQTLSDVFLQDLDAAFRPIGSPRQLPPAGDWNGTPRLLEDRHEVLVCAGSVPRLALWRQPVDGSAKPVTLGIIGDHAVQSAVDRARGRIVFRTLRFDFDILRFPLPEAGATHGTPPATTPREPPVQEFVESTFADRSPAYSPDGSQVAFISDRTGRRQLWVSDSSGEKPTEWTSPPRWTSQRPPGRMTDPGSSSRGRARGLGSTVRRRSRHAHGGSRHQRRAGLCGGRVVARWRAALRRRLGQNAYAIYRLPSAGGAAEKILPNYAAVAGVEPTGKGLYAVRRVNRNQGQLDYVPFPAGPAVHLAALNFLEDAWVTRDGVYYLERRGDTHLAPVALKFRTHAGAVKLLQEYSKPPGRGLSVSADGRFAATTRVLPPISDLMLLETTK